MLVRKATRDDLLAIGRVADVAHWQDYEGLLAPATISKLLRRDFSPSSLKRRLLTGSVLVVETAGRIAGFADAEIAEGHIRLRNIAIDPERDPDAAALSLLGAVQTLAPGLPVCADVVLGNVQSELFYEKQGFVPGETLHEVVLDEPLIERRWWLSS
jgi:N-acetylglutamate synthase-like GNAT family acetyltransferase